MAIDYFNKDDPNEKNKTNAAGPDRQEQKSAGGQGSVTSPGSPHKASSDDAEPPQAQGPAPSAPLGTAGPPGSGDESHGEPHGERRGARGTAAMDPGTRREVARKGGQAVSRNREHMAEIGRKGGQSVSRNREHMARIGRKGGTASRGHGNES